MVGKSPLWNGISLYRVIFKFSYLFPTRFLKYCYFIQTKYNNTIFLCMIKEYKKVEFIQNNHHRPQQQPWNGGAHHYDIYGHISFQNDVKLLPFVCSLWLDFSWLQVSFRAFFTWNISYQLLKQFRNAKIVTLAFVIS